MYIRAVKKQRSKTSKVFYQYTLAQTVRVDKKVKQRSILYLGSDDALADKTNRQMVLSVLKSLIHQQPELYPSEIPDQLQKLAESYYEKYKLRYGDALDEGASLPPLPKKSDTHQVDISTLEVQDVRTFGAEHLCSQVLDRLVLGDILKNAGLSKGEVQQALMAIAARAIFTSSEHKTAQYLNTSSELAMLYGIATDINHKQLYKIADKLYKNREHIDQSLYQRITNIFNLEDRLVIYDISNTYFETSKRNSRLAKYGRSKEKRKDCPLVVFTGVINAEGFIRHSRIYEGNKPDSQTLSDMLQDLQQYSASNVKKTVVIDAGIADEDNLELLKQKGYEYVCVSRKKLKDYAFKESTTQLTDREKSQVELAILKPKENGDTMMYVKSEAKGKKETSMDQKLTNSFEQDLTTAKEALQKKGGTKKLEKVWLRIGRIKEKHKRVSAQYEITIKNQNDKATDIIWKQKSPTANDDKKQGVYFIRTNYKEPNEKQLWNVYNTIREVESTFRCLKTDLQLRPVHHQNDQRIASHIYLSMLSYQLVNTIRHMLKADEIKYSWQNILRIMKTHTIQTIELPTDKKTVHLRKPSKPTKEVQEIYTATLCKQTQKAVKKYVVYH